MEDRGGVPLEWDDSIFTKPIPDTSTENQQDSSDAIPNQVIDSASEPASAPEVTELDGPDGLHLTSMGNAKRFLRDYRSDVLWWKVRQSTPLARSTHGTGATLAAGQRQSDVPGERDGLRFE